MEMTLAESTLLPATESLAHRLTLDEAGQLLSNTRTLRASPFMSPSSCARVGIWKSSLEQPETVVDFGQLIRGVNGPSFLCSEPLPLLPVKRLTGATALQLGNPPLWARRFLSSSESSGFVLSTSALRLRSTSPKSCPSGDPGGQSFGPTPPSRCPTSQRSFRPSTFNRLAVPTISPLFDFERHRD